MNNKDVYYYATIASDYFISSEKLTLLSDMILPFSLIMATPTIIII